MLKINGTTDHHSTITTVPAFLNVQNTKEMPHIMSHSKIESKNAISNTDDKTVRLRGHVDEPASLNDVRLQIVSKNELLVLDGLPHPQTLVDETDKSGRRADPVVHDLVNSKYTTNSTLNITKTSIFSNNRNQSSQISSSTTQVTTTFPTNTLSTTLTTSHNSLQQHLQIAFPQSGQRETKTKEESTRRIMDKPLVDFHSAELKSEANVLPAVDWNIGRTNLTTRKLLFKDATTRSSLASTTTKVSLLSQAALGDLNTTLIDEPDRMLYSHLDTKSK